MFIASHKYHPKNRLKAYLETEVSITHLDYQLHFSCVFSQDFPRALFFFAKGKKRFYSFNLKYSYCKGRSQRIVSKISLLVRSNMPRWFPLNCEEPLKFSQDKCLSHQTFNERMAMGIRAKQFKPHFYLEKNIRNQYGKPVGKSVVFSCLFSPCSKVFPGTPLLSSV